MIAWHDAFGGAFESAWGLTQKLAWLNKTDSTELFTAVGFRHALQDPDSGARTFVHGDWLKERCNSTDISAHVPTRDLADVSRALYLRTGSLLLGRLAPYFMSNRLRVCPLCIRRGYHSIVHQIAGLVGCPMHGVPLISTCPTCDHSFGDFGLRSYVAPFQCAQCHAHLLEGDELYYFPEAWRQAEERTIGALVTHLRSLEHIHLDWTGANCVPLFRVAGKEQVLTITNAEAYLWALHQISPLPVFGPLLCPEPAGLIITPRPDAVALAGRKRKHDSISRIELRKHIDRVVVSVRTEVERLARGHSDCIYAADHLLSVHRMYCNSWLRHDPLLCPIGQGHYLWRERVRQYVCDMQKCRDKAPIERYCRDALSKLPVAFLSSFYASVVGVMLMLDFINRGDRRTRDYLDAWRSTENDAWLPEGPDTMAGFASVSATHDVALCDPEVFTVVHCDEGAAMIRSFSPARLTYHRQVSDWQEFRLRLRDSNITNAGADVT